MNATRFSLPLLVFLTAIHANCGTAPGSAPQSAATQPSAAAAAPAPVSDGDSEEVSEAVQTVTFGSYTHAHAAFDECDQAEPCEVEVTDTFVIADAAGGFVDVVAELTQDNDNGCSFEGRMKNLAPNHWTWTDDAQVCHVELRLTESAFDLTSDGCRETYCGARAYLEASFPLAGITSPTP